MAAFQGSLVVIIISMYEDGELDFDAFRWLIDWHIKEGTNDIVVINTTNKSPTMN